MTRAESHALRRLVAEATTLAQRLREQANIYTEKGGPAAETRRAAERLQTLADEGRAALREARHASC